MNTRRLYRSRYDRQIAGVAGGMAEYLDLDPTIVRIGWILSALLGGLTIVLYAILAFVIPLAPAPAAGAAESWPIDADGNAVPEGSAERAQPAEGWRDGVFHRAGDRRGGGAGIFVGVLLVVFGMIALADSVLPGWVDGGRLGPALLLALGAAVLVSSVRRPADER